MPEFTSEQIVGMVVCFLATILAVTGAVCIAVCEVSLARAKARIASARRESDLDDTFSSNEKALWRKNEEERHG